MSEQSIYPSVQNLNDGLPFVAAERRRFLALDFAIKFVCGRDIKRVADDRVCQIAAVYEHYLETGVVQKPKPAPLLDVMERAQHDVA